MEEKAAAVQDQDEQQPSVAEVSAKIKPPPKIKLKKLVGPGEAMADIQVEETQEETASAPVRKKISVRPMMMSSNNVKLATSKPLIKLQAS